MQKGLTMQNVRALFVIVSAIAVLATAAVLTASLAVAFAGILAILSIGRALSLQLKPIPVKAQTDKRGMRVWNDGRGTIIDL
jgi:hypothetical protein